MFPEFHPLVILFENIVSFTLIQFISKHPRDAKKKSLFVIFLRKVWFGIIISYFPPKIKSVLSFSNFISQHQRKFWSGIIPHFHCSIKSSTA